MSNKSLLLPEYCGYVGSIEHSKKDNLFYGSVQFITDGIFYESETLEGLQKAFEDAVDEYLADCKAMNRKPNTTCKGSFNVRLPQQLHVDLVRYSVKHEQSLNKTMIQASESFLESERTYRYQQPELSLKKFKEALASTAHGFYGCLG